MTEQKLKILITGALGKLGREFVRHYSADFDFALTDCASKCDDKNGPYLSCDIKDKNACAELFGWAKSTLGGLDGFVHCGAVSAPGQDQVLTFEVNAAGSFYLMQECVKHDVANVILITSGWVQGLPSPDIKPFRFPIDEETVGSYKDVYHIAKKFNEMNGKMLVDSGQLKKVVSLRMGGIYDVSSGCLGDLSTDAYWTRVSTEDCALSIYCALVLPQKGFDYFLIGSKFRYGVSGALETWSELKAKLELNGFSELIDGFEGYQPGDQTYCLDKSFEVLKFQPKY